MLTTDFHDRVSFTWRYTLECGEPCPSSRLFYIFVCYRFFTMSFSIFLFVITFSQCVLSTCTKTASSVSMSTCVFLFYLVYFPLSCCSTTIHQIIFTLFYNIIMSFRCTRPVDRTGQ